MTWKHLYRCLYMNFVALLIFIEVTYICGDSISGGTSRSELGALKLLYWATGGDRWRQGWDVQNEMSDPCIDRWYGITCDAEGHLIYIRLANNNLIGYVPDEFPRPALRALRELDLSSNYLTGTVPTTLMQLTSLRVLRLAGNYFNGPFPSSIGQLTQLEVLEIQVNQFSIGANGFVLTDDVQRLAREKNCHMTTD